MSFDPLDFLKQANEGKLDSRLKTATVTHPTFPLERTYCVICGEPRGWVSQESSKYIAVSNIFLICDDCENQFGKPPLPEADIKEIKIK
jgi:hypothetical protein